MNIITKNIFNGKKRTSYIFKKNENDKNTYWVSHCDTTNCQGARTLSEAILVEGRIENLFT